MMTRKREVSIQASVSPTRQSLVGR